MSLKFSEVKGNSQYLDGGSMFGNAPRAMWEKWIPPDSKGRIPLACRAMLIECEDKKILCETGIGAFFEPKMADRFGVQDSHKHVLLENLEKIGVAQLDIDYVILSHLHFDHAGGLLPTHDEISSGNDQLCFPNARYVVGAKSWQRACKPHSRDRASFIPGLTDKLKSSDRLIIVEDNCLPGLLDGQLSFTFTDGHTPGQMHSLFKGADHSIFFAGDLVPGTHWLHSAITMGYDRYPEKAIDEKNELYHSALAEGNWLLFYTHDHEVAASGICRNEKGRIVVADPILQPVRHPL